MRALHVRICGDENRTRADFTVSGNTGRSAAKGTSLLFTNVKGVTVSRNKQPLSSGQLGTFPGSSNVTYRK